MTLLVSMHVYSGMPNPVWTLSEDEEKELVASIEALGTLETPLMRDLGYRGFSILRTEADEGIQPMLFENAESDEVVGSFISGQPDIEDFLLWTAGDSLEDELAEYVREVIISEPPEALDDQALAAFKCPPCGGAIAPAYNPAYWNNDITRRRNNNCYNYANNRATNTFAQPGRGSGRKFSSLTCGDVGAAAGRDGLRRVPNFAPSVSGWYAALVIWPGTDYHWYRQDSVGCWSHKPGQTNVRNVDNSGHRIADPRRADRGPYTNFCSFYVTNYKARIS